MRALLERFLGNPKTTLGGMGFGGVFAGVVMAMVEQAGCQFGQVSWWELFMMLWAGPAIVGAAATDAAPKEP